MFFQAILFVVFFRGVLGCFMLFLREVLIIVVGYIVFRVIYVFCFFIFLVLRVLVCFFGCFSPSLCGLVVFPCLDGCRVVCVDLVICALVLFLCFFFLLCCVLCSLFCAVLCVCLFSLWLLSHTTVVSFFFSFIFGVLLFEPFEPWESFCLSCFLSWVSLICRYWLAALILSVSWVLSCFFLAGPGLFVYYLACRLFLCVG